MLRPDQWKIFGGTVEMENPQAQADHVDVEVIVRDTTNRNDQNTEIPFYFTDLQFQPGHQKTGWIPNTQYLMDRIEYDVDEWRKYKTKDDLGNVINDPYYIWKTVSPQQYPGMDHRIFNLMGRGHEIITLPNDLPEEKFWRLQDVANQGLEKPVEILSTGIDFTLIPKDDFDLCRIATNIGSVLPEEEWHYKPILDEYANSENASAKSTVESTFRNHPLHTRYTREFWFTGGQAGDILETHASIQVARHNGAVIPTQGVHTVQIGTGELEIYKNKYHLIPRGSVRFVIEFYKQVDLTIGLAEGSGSKTVQYLKDTGIGFGGTAKFKQWTYGVERI